MEKKFRLIAFWVGCLVLGLIVIFVYVGMSRPNVAQIETTEAVILTPEEEAAALKASLIPVDTLKAFMAVLTSEKLDGRFPGTEGNTLAAEAIRDKMTEIGLTAPSFTESYYMPFEMVVPSKKSETTMQLAHGTEQIEFSFGEEFVEYVGRDFAKGVGSYEGEFVIIDDPFELYDFESLGNPEAVVYTEKAVAATSYETLFAGILSASTPPKVVLYENSQQNSGHFVISPYSRMVLANDNEKGLLIYKIAPEALDVLKQKSTGTLTLQTNVVLERVKVPNVLGMIDGTGDTGVIISAHFDHLGNNLDGTFNPGALDNASGVTVMLSLASAIAKTANPAMDYYFVAFNGEEEGLYGSEAFVLSESLEPSKFKVINVDMVGSSQDIPVDISSTADQSLPLQKELIAFSETKGLATQPSSKGSSDHVPMESVGFQVVSLTEFDQRYYHTPGDTVENSIDFIEMQNIAAFIYNFIYEW